MLISRAFRRAVQYSARCVTVTAITHGVALECRPETREESPCTILV